MDHAHVKLGRQPFKPHPRDLKLSNYLASKTDLLETSRAPAASDWTQMPTPSGPLPKRDCDPLGNISYGDCALAAPAHMVRLIGQLVSRPELFPTTPAVLQAYSLIAGFNLETGANDVGTTIRDVLNTWQKAGLYGTRALAYALVSNDPDEIALASWLGCGTIGGYRLPRTAQNQHNDSGRQLWHVPKGGFPAGMGPGTWGDHCIYSPKTSPKLRGGNSWGEDTLWTDEFDHECCEERWIVLVDAWYDPAAGRAPNGFAIDDLLADVRARS